MRRHHLTALVVGLLAAAVLTSGGTDPARAASRYPAAPPRALPALPAAPAARETSKVTLPESSIDGPALGSVFFPHLGSASVIAWTGTDPAHHLNVETISSDLNVSNKLTLPETSPYRPDVQMSAPGSPVTIAWTGTDPNHSLNVLYDVHGAFGTPKKLTLVHENSNNPPALLVKLGSPGQGSSGMYLAWTGTDPNHSLNILPIDVTVSGLVPGEKTVLPQFSSDAGPHLAGIGVNATVVLSWTSRTLQLKVATSTDGAHFAPDQGVGLPETSAFAPDTVNTNFYPETNPRDWIGWTGTDPDHHLNLQWTLTFPQFPDPSGSKTTLDETALGGPALGYNFGGQIAWTGTDPAHHLNIAKFAFS